MVAALRTAFQFVALAVAVAVSQVLASLLTSWIPQPPIPDAGGTSPLTLAQAAIAVTAIWAVLLGLLAAHVHGGYWRRSAFLFVYVYAVNCLLSAIEAAFYLPVVRMQAMNVVAMVASGGIFAALVAPAAAALFPSTRMNRLPLQRSSRPGWVVVFFYIAAYSLAGYFIAWQSEAVRTYYDNGRNIPVVWMLPLQLARGAVWWGLTAYGIRQLRGHRHALALLVGACDAAFMAIALLLPGPLMPWPVRAVHLLEIGTANSLFGVVAFLWLSEQSPGTQARAYSP
jgi:hypothetical protein